MNLEEIKNFIEKTSGDYYILDFRKLLLTFSLHQSYSHQFEQFISKIMEIERTFIEHNDKPLIYLKRDLKSCDVYVEKSEGGRWKINIKPYGFMGFWEIFHFER